MPGVRYPRDREADIALKDGSTLRVRPVRGDDADGIRAFLDRLSAQSTVFRFFGVPNVEWVTGWSIDVDYADRFALVAETGNPTRIVAHAAYIRSAPDRAEVAFMVADEMQGHGIATTLLAHLASIAAENGITTFTAEVMPANHRMVETFRESGFPIDIRSSPESLEIEIGTSVTREARTRFDERERMAAVAAVKAVLEPVSVAVIGASRKPGTVGREILHNLLAAGFNGPVYPVNPAADTVLDLPAYPSVRDVPGHVELAVVAVPAEQVAPVARDCALAGVRALVVVSSGFAETGPDGAARQRELLQICRASGIRVVGPNCIGVLNTNPQIRLNATFVPRQALPGAVGFMSQSGGLGVAIIEAASRLGLGLSSFVAVGNKADLSGNDMLSYWEQDDRTTVAMLYLESFGNPRKFARLAPRFSRQKPLLAVKSGRSVAGARATESHTGTERPQSDVTVDALFDQAGVIRTDTLHELFAVAQLLATQPVPRGDRVAIVSNAGGPGIMCADACQADGVDVPEFTADVQRKLSSLLPADASVTNPVDLLADSAADDYAKAVTALIEADACDAILTIFVPSLRTTAQEVAIAVRGAAERAVASGRPGVSIAAVFMTEESAPPELRSVAMVIPGYEFPEDAARAVALAAKHGRWRSRPVPDAGPLAGVHPERAAAIISAALGAGDGLMPEPAVDELMASYGLEVSGSDPPPDSVELTLGMVNDRNFGPVLALRAGGIAGDLMSDESLRLTPLSALDAREMPRALKIFPLLNGYRGAPRCDVTSLEDVLQRVSAIVEHHREIVALDLSPLHVSPNGTLISDATVQVRDTAPPPPAPSLKAY